MILARDGLILVPFDLKTALAGFGSLAIRRYRFGRCSTVIDCRPGHLLENSTLAGLSSFDFHGAGGVCIQALNRATGSLVLIQGTLESI